MGSSSHWYLHTLKYFVFLDTELMMTIMIMINTHSAPNKLLFVADPVQCKPHTYYV